jgi:hypothetical protein
MKYDILVPSLCAALLAACTPDSMAAPDPGDRASSADRSRALPVEDIEHIVGAEGVVAGGVLDITIARTDIGEVRGPAGVTFTPAFEIHGRIAFQPVGAGKALLNLDMALREDETNPFIARLLQRGLVFQAFHQHLPMPPQVWFVHARAIGEPLALARGVRAALDVTHTPLPQTLPPHTTPLDPQRLARILHGEAMVGADGVVTVVVPRTDRIMLDGVRVSPRAGISTEIEFKPTATRTRDGKPGDPANAQVCPDFSMLAGEVVPVVKQMLLDKHWIQGSLRNDETNQQPPLFYDAMVKEGDAYQLAQEIRAGLDLTHTR